MTSPYSKTPPTEDGDYYVRNAVYNRTRILTLSRGAWFRGQEPVTLGLDEEYGLKIPRAEELVRYQHCPRCGSKEWFPGAACWHCGWEWGPEEDLLTPEERGWVEYLRTYEWDESDAEEADYYRAIIDRLAPKPEETT